MTHPNVVAHFFEMAQDIKKDAEASFKKKPSTTVAGLA